MKKKCAKCKEKKDVKYFRKSKRHSSGYQSWCKKCQTENTMRIYKEDPMPFVKRAREHAAKKVRYVVAYLRKHSCVDCGEHNIIILEFDHLPQYKKIANISRIVRRGSIQQIKNEIAKCEVVCANCHKIRTVTRGNWIYKTEDAL